MHYIAVRFNFSFVRRHEHFRFLSRAVDHQYVKSFSVERGSGRVGLAKDESHMGECKRVLHGPAVLIVFDEAIEYQMWRVGSIRIYKVIERRVVISVLAIIW